MHTYGISVYYARVYGKSSKSTAEPSEISAKVKIVSTSITNDASLMSI